MNFKKVIPSNDGQSDPAPSAPSSATAPPASSPSPSSVKDQQNLLSSDVIIKGKVRFTNGLIVDGKIDGEIESSGLLTVQENARLKAEIKTRSIEVHGKVQGNITVSEQVVIRKTAEVIGDIKAATLSVEAGAIFVGNSTVGVPANTPSRVSTPPSKEQAGQSPSGGQPKKPSFENKMAGAGTGAP